MVAFLRMRCFNVASGGTVKRKIYDVSPSILASEQDLIVGKLSNSRAAQILFNNGGAL